MILVISFVSGCGARMVLLADGLFAEGTGLGSLTGTGDGVVVAFVLALAFFVVFFPGTFFGGCFLTAGFFFVAVLPVAAFFTGPFFAAVFFPFFAGIAFFLVAMADVLKRFVNYSEWFGFQICFGIAEIGCIQ
ncbi:MAG: hypothetical protein EOO09_15795 [Chitinophagaceae bacterium]|nr:MAG: hypothetical protein EOO09_15795 [Chitinophagaceae bacterium]